MFKHLFILFAPMLCAVALSPSAYAGGRPIHRDPEVIEWCQLEVVSHTFESKSFEELHPVCKTILYEDHGAHLWLWKAALCILNEDNLWPHPNDYRFCTMFERSEK